MQDHGHSSLQGDRAARSLLQAAVDRLRAGGLVAFPTETVYGLGADARNPLAVRRIFAAKGRPADHPLIVHLASARQLGDWALPDGRADILARAFWPGPLTMILHRRPSVPDEVTGGRDTVGLRVPGHPLARALLRAFGDGIAAPSANRFGRVSPTTADHVRQEFGPSDDEHGVLVLDGGPCQVGVESTIVDLSVEPAAVLRPGAITQAQLAEHIGPLAPPDGSTAAPGTLPSHYAPRTALRLSTEPQAEAARLRSEGLRVAVLLASDPVDHARRLYAELRRLDALGVDVLVVEPSGRTGLGRAIDDRLARAAHRGD